MIGAIGKSSRLQAKSGMLEMKAAVEARMRGNKMASIVELQSRLGRKHLQSPAGGGFINLGRLG